MRFNPENLSEFLSMYNKRRKEIRSQDGCLHLEMWQDLDDPCLIFTYSKWQDSLFLEVYRTSELFEEIWAKTKAGFSERAEAWSVRVRDELLGS